MDFFCVARVKRMNPILWGPAVWQAMLACAWTCRVENSDALVRLMTLIVTILPCEKCRTHYQRHRMVLRRRAKGEPRKPQEVFRWIWLLKDEVNKSLGQPSISFEDLTERFRFHGGVVDEVLLGDTLVLFAVSCLQLQWDAEFMQLCGLLAALLPLPCDSQLKAALECIRQKPIVPAAVRAAKAARTERGLPVLNQAHYLQMAAE